MGNCVVINVLLMLFSIYSLIYIALVVEDKDWSSYGFGTAIIKKHSEAS